MPSYSYHLKFELFPTQDPSAQAENENVWVPTAGATIFDDLPRHPRKRAPLRSTRQQQKSVEESRDRSLSRRRQQSGVIDCGPSRAAVQEDNGNIVRLSERQWRKRSKSFPAPGFAAGLGPKAAARDWRFGQLSIESFDTLQPGNMVGQTSATPAASLGPTLGGAGQATKAKYIALEAKNTEVGWGIVHLYREGHDSPARDSGAVAEDDQEAESGDDRTILCIPAVPSYLSPSDFLGFVGEKWGGGVSHYRMVMTSRMNQYMVLMKFRNSKRADEWRKEFDGKVFNSMEVSRTSRMELN